MTSPPDHRVLALRYGTLQTTARALFSGWDATGEPDRPWRQDYFVWTIGGIVVDTGFAPEVGARRGRRLVRPVSDLLAGAGLDPGAVTEVILSHAHYDHIGNLDQFPRARFTLAREELDAARAALRDGVDPADPLEPGELEQLLVLEREGRLRTFERSLTLAPGIELITVGGHTPGELVVVVRGETGSAVLAADSVHFAVELERDLPYAIADDPAGLGRGYRIVRELVAEEEAALVPGHDPAVLRRFPPLAGLEGESALVLEG